jgi:hypothetical protein
MCFVIYTKFEKNNLGMDKNILACYNPFQQKKFYLLKTIFVLIVLCFQNYPQDRKEIYKEDVIGA